MNAAEIDKGHGDRYFTLDNKTGSLGTEPHRFMSRTFVEDVTQHGTI